MLKKIKKYLHEDYPRRIPKPIFTACTGRCGQATLVDYFNTFAHSTVAEFEPPQVKSNHYPWIGNIIRDFQRRFIYTDTMLGRGVALKWYKNSDWMKLRCLAKKRLARVNKKFQCDHYVEVSKFFIRTYYEATYRINPDIGVIYLHRDPCATAKSFMNRQKDFGLDNPMPWFRNVAIPLGNLLTKYQMYLWLCLEVEKRYWQFISRCNIKKHYEIRTEDLDNPKAIEDLFDYFGIQYAPVQTLIHSNTNAEKGFSETVVTEGDRGEYRELLAMINRKWIYLEAKKMPIVTMDRKGFHKW